MTAATTPSHVTIEGGGQAAGQLVVSLRAEGFAGGLDQFELDVVRHDAATSRNEMLNSRLKRLI